MFAVVPITGFLVFGGNLRAMWGYTKAWLRVIGMMIGAALVLLALLYPLITPPQ